MESVPDALSSDDSGVYVAPSSRKNKRKSSEPRRRREVLKKSSSSSWNESDSETERPSSSDSGIRADDKATALPDAKEVPRKTVIRPPTKDPMLLECPSAFVGMKGPSAVPEVRSERATPESRVESTLQIPKKEATTRLLPKKRPYEAQAASPNFAIHKGSEPADTCLDLTARRIPSSPPRTLARPSPSSVSNGSQPGSKELTFTVRPVTSHSSFSSSAPSFPKALNALPGPSRHSGLHSPYTCRLISAGAAPFSASSSSSPEPSALPSTSSGGPSFAAISPAPLQRTSETYSPSRSRKCYSSSRERPFDASDIELIPRTAPEELRCSPARKGPTGMSRQRRIEANARERTRVHTISAAFEALRRAVPAYADNQKLSKLAILRIAAAYILALARLNDRDYSCDQRAPSFAECIEVCTRTIQMEGKARRRSRETLDLSS